MKSKMIKFARKVQHHKKYFQAAKSVLEVVSQARKGGRFSKVLAGLSATGILLDTINFQPNSWQLMKELNLKHYHMFIGSFIVKELSKFEPPIIMNKKEGTTVKGWANDDGEICLVAVCEYDDVFIHLDPEGKGLQLLQGILQKIWGLGNELRVTRSNIAKSHDRSIDISPIGPLDLYVNKSKSSKWYADRIKRYGYGARTICLRGPTGVGKSVLARHIGKLLKKESRTLKISSQVLNSCSESEIIGLVKWLEPTVLILDDLNLGSTVNTQTFLSLLEAIRDPNCLIIVTTMTNIPNEKEPVKGDWYYPGMRPGRIDETFTLKLPNAEERKAILKAYIKLAGNKTIKPILNNVIDLTEGLSGAYLKAVVERLHVHGIQNYEDEINHVHYISPSLET
jgi:hypothetical protein